VDLDEEAAPARHVGAGDLDGAGGGAAAAEHPGCEPGLDLRGQMAEDVAVGEVHPDAGLLLDGRAGDEEEFVASGDAIEEIGAGAEDGAVDGGPEVVRAVGRERGWCAGVHGE
jgi:hypothetical protein